MQIFESAAAASPRENCGSRAIASPKSTPSARPRARARMESTLRSIARASVSNALPSGVSVGRWANRSKRVTPRWPSRFPIEWLIADWARDKRPATARKLPASATATKTRI